MRVFLRSLIMLVALILLATIATRKLGGLFPAMDTAAWVIVLACFCAVLVLSIRVDTWLRRAPWGRLQENEALREYLAITAVVLVGGLALVLLWPLIGKFLGGHFGTAALR